MKRDPHRPNRSGFTLVELLVVIAIIGILVTMTVTGIAVVRRSAASGQISMEVSQLAMAVEAYKQKYGDYPPDFSDPAIVNRHFRKAFSKILNTEILLLANAMARYQPASDPASGIDRAEALVFCLGGFSDDPQHPFTGPGGPLQVIDPANAGSTLIDHYQYNSDRRNRIYDFDMGRLTLFTQTLPLRSWDDTQDSATLSSYEVEPAWDLSLGNNDPTALPTQPTGTPAYLAAVASDPFPVFLPRGREMPYVYFDSRTYGFTSSVGYYFNRYEPRDTSGASYKGIARPYKSSEIRTAALTGAAPATTDLDRLDAVRAYASKDSFQVISAGFDDHFGGVSALVGGAAVNFIAQSGKAFNASLIPVSTWPPTGDVSGLGIDTSAGGEFKYGTASLDPLAQQDNVASFASGTLISNVTE